MQKSKVTVTALNKTFNFQASMGSMLKLLDARIATAQAEKVMNDKKASEIEVLQAQAKEAHVMLDLVADLLHMSDNEKKQLVNSATADEISDIIVDISDKLQGVTADDRSKSKSHKH